MTPQLGLSDPLLLAIWHGGRPADAASLGVRDAEGFTHLESLLRAGLVEKTLLSSIYCERDGERLLLVDGARALTCSRCGNTIELGKDESLGFYSFQASMPTLTKLVCSAFAEHGLPPKGGGTFQGNRDVSAIGTFRADDGSDVDLLLARREVGPGCLLQVWGHCASASRSTVVVHPGLSTHADSYLRLSFQASPIYTIHGSAICDGGPFEAARRFPAFRRSIASRLEGVESALFDAGGVESIGERVDPFGVEADELSRHGGARYEPVALQMLSVLGPTLRFSRRAGVKQVPDGILVLPDGVWIVDAKSSEVGFRYNQGERDKAWRYLETIERRLDQFNASWKFYGEVIVARTDPIQANDLALARADLRARDASSVVSVVSHEGLLHLWQRARDTTDYWYRRLLGEDPRDLLLLNPRFLPKGPGNDEARSSADTPLRIVTAPVIESYWDSVLKNPYPTLSGRNPRDVLTGLEEMFIRDYAA
jgi:hypothetical protein